LSNDAHRPFYTAALWSALILAFNNYRHSQEQAIVGSNEVSEAAGHLAQGLGVNNILQCGRIPVSAARGMEPITYVGEASNDT
jgi:hypothetical protein